MGAGKAIAVDRLAPCPRCGSLELWETLEGEWRCVHCDGAVFHRSRQLASRAARLRRGEPLTPMRRRRPVRLV